MDIETSPMLMYRWGIFDDGNGAIDQIYRDWHILTWAARWLGKAETMSDSMRHDPAYVPWSDDDSRPVKSLWKLFDEADWVIGHNLDRFDIKKMNARFMLHDLPQPSPYKTIDTLKIARSRFAFTSNKLDYLGQKLCGRRKVQHQGHALWRGCLAGDADCWTTMLKYNVGDIDLQEQVYFKLRGWDKRHPNFGIYSNAQETVCTVCGSTNLTRLEKTIKTNVSEFPGYQCGKCGHAMRTRKNIRSPDTAPLVNAL
jgi:hypothetical protein